MAQTDRDLESICALSTPVGTGALALVRLSGPKALAIAKKVAPFLPETPETHRAYFGRLVSSETESEFDEALVTYFAPGRSFTGEETLEFSTHGSQAIVQELLKSLVSHGAKAAGRGEFTYRAFMNGKLDLVQAESVLALIEAQSSLSAKQALRQLKGGLSAELEKFESEIIWGLAHIEAGIDFSTEGLETVDRGELVRRLSGAQQGLERWLETFENGRLLREGLQVVLMGKPNVGKSSLLNAVLNEDKAIVTEVAGTTRDLIEASVLVRGIRTSLIDTAGLRESDDVVERIGIERTHKASKEADLIFFVFDAREGLSQEDKEVLRGLNSARTFLIANKMDRVDAKGTIEAETLKKLQEFGLQTPPKMLFVSALDKKAARETLVRLLEEWVGTHQVEDQSILFQARHFERLSEASAKLKEGLALVRDGLSPELAALELKEALLAVQETLGKHFDDQILDRVFKEFCIGK